MLTPPVVISRFKQVKFLLDFSVFPIDFLALKLYITNKINRRMTSTADGFDKDWKDQA